MSLVLRSWTAGSDDPDFWNPKIRSPICLNAPAARTYLPITLMKTQLILAGKSKEEMFQAIASALDKNRLTSIRPVPKTILVFAFHWGWFGISPHFAACRIPCQRFVSHPAVRFASLGVSAACYSFTAVDFHHLLLAQSPGALASFISLSSDDPIYG